MSARLSQKHAAHADKAVRAPFTRFLNRPWATGQPKRQERGCLHPRTVRKTPAAFARMWASALLFCHFRNSL